MNRINLAVDYFKQNKKTWRKKILLGIIIIIIIIYRCSGVKIYFAKFFFISLKTIISFKRKYNIMVNTAEVDGYTLNLFQTKKKSTIICLPKAAHTHTHTHFVLFHSVKSEKTKKNERKKNKYESTKIENIKWQIFFFFNLKFKKKFSFSLYWIYICILFCPHQHHIRYKCRSHSHTQI